MNRYDLKLVVVTVINLCQQEVSCFDVQFGIKLGVEGKMRSSIGE